MAVGAAAEVARRGAGHTVAERGQDFAADVARVLMARAATLPADADAVVITSKDAVKWQTLDNGKLWVLPVTAQLDAGLVSWLVSTLKEQIGRAHV